MKGRPGVYRPSTGQWFAKPSGGGIPWSVTFGQSGDVAVQPVVAPGMPAHQEAYVEYYSLDALGSVRAVTDAAGLVLRRHDFLPFGEEWQPPVPSGEARLFTGQERDAETGLDYFGARYYRQDLGRFTTVDAVQTTVENLADPQRWNRYAYALNNPLRYVDPTGAEIELLPDSREQALALFQKTLRLLGDIEGASLLYIRDETTKAGVRYYLGIKGSIADFMKRSEFANFLGDLVQKKQIMEFGFTTEDLSKWSGARTIDPAGGLVANPRVLINGIQVLSIDESKNRWTRRFGGMVARDFNDQVAWAHEFGHGWALIHGRGPVDSASSNAEAIYWENRMRVWWYGPPGPTNPLRRIH